MYLRMTFVSMTAFALLSALSACEIHTCEHGSTCTDWKPSDEEHQACNAYCVRLSVCGAPQAQDLNECVNACLDRFEVSPTETRNLCECASTSVCGDVIEGRCSASSTPPPSTSGGSCSICSSGGATGSGGVTGSGGALPSTGGATGSGATGNGGTVSSSGGATGHGGSSSAAGGVANGGSSAGSAGEAPTAVACNAPCDCPLGQACVSGYCVTP